MQCVYTTLTQGLRKGKIGAEKWSEKVPPLAQQGDTKLDLLLQLGIKGENIFS